MEAPDAEDEESEDVLNQALQIGTRKFMTAKFLKIFYEQEKNAETKNIIENFILKDTEGSFGGLCTYMDKNCYGDSLITTSGSLLPSSSPIRSAKIHNTCQKVLGITASIESALKAAGLNLTSSGSESSNIEKVFDVFYPGMPITDEAKSNLMNIYKESREQGLNDSDSWKMVMDPMCKTALFESY